MEPPRSARRIRLLYTCCKQQVFRYPILISCLTIIYPRQSRGFVKTVNRSKRLVVRELPKGELFVFLEQFHLVESSICLFLGLDVRSYGLFVQPYGRYAITSGPKALTYEVASPATHPGYVDRALPFDKAYHLGNGILGGTESNTWTWSTTSFPSITSLSFCLANSLMMGPNSFLSFP